MSKRGRPPKPPEDRRSERVDVWVTPAEEVELQAKADAEACTVSALLMKPHREGK